MRRVTLVPFVLLLAGCGSQAVVLHDVQGRAVTHCRSGAQIGVGTRRVAYAGIASSGAVVYRRPGGPVLARFGETNVNGYATIFGVVGDVVGRDCKPRWYRVQVPVKPNGITGYVRPHAVELAPVTSRISVDLSARTLTLYSRGRAVLTVAVAVGSSSTPTPTGSFYVNQRLIPSDPSGPFGPAAIGISAFSNVLTGWAQGGPIAIHGTNEPWSIGHAVSNGCIRLPNATLRRIYPLAVAGTPVIVHA
jgi:hypothetical protein